MSLDLRIERLGPARLPNPVSRFGATPFVADDLRLPLHPHIRADAEGQARTETQSADCCFELAGPRAEIFFEPSEVRAAIVTCGGLCPGLNAVVRGLVNQLSHRYGVNSIIGLRNGYNGLGSEAEVPMVLTVDKVSGIHTLGGTLLGTSRGAPSPTQMLGRLQDLGINMLFVIGGDGTMRGATQLCAEIRRIGANISIVGVPKTIDNDIPYVRRSFGFETAVEHASEAIDAAHVEARSAPAGIGLVKLMGRHAGYIAATAALASGNANFCLVPEINFALESSPGAAPGLFDVLETRLRRRKHAVIVVAEGAGQSFFDGSPERRDASGNRKLGDIGQYLRDRINAHFASHRDLDVTLKYIDPSYMIRAAPPNPTDQLFCTRLAQNAVHAAMSGRTGLLIGYWHGQMTHVPMLSLAGETQRINPNGQLWSNILETLGQPPQIGV